MVYLGLYVGLGPDIATSDNGGGGAVNLSSSAGLLTLGGDVTATSAPGAGGVIAGTALTGRHLSRPPLPLATPSS